MHNDGKTISDSRRITLDNPSYEADGGVNTSHYNFTYRLTRDDIARGEIRIDPYFVSSVWKFPDVTGCLFHILKTIARFGAKNTVNREIDSIIKTAKRLDNIVNNK